MRTTPRCTAPRSTPWPDPGPGRSPTSASVGSRASSSTSCRSSRTIIVVGGQLRSSSTASSRTPAIRCSTLPSSRSASPASRRFRSGAGAPLTARYDGVWTDTTYYDATEGLGIPNHQNVQFLPEGTIAQRPFWLHNLRLAYRPPGGRIEIAGWVRNLTNEAYKTLRLRRQHLQRDQHLLRGRSANLRRHADRHLLKRRLGIARGRRRVRGSCSRARAAG